MKVAKLLDDRKAIDVTVIDISPKASFADYFVMASAGSDRQMGALVDNVEDMLEPAGIFPKERRGKEKLRMDTDGLRRCGHKRDDRRDA